MTDNLETLEQEELVELLIKEQNQNSDLLEKSKVAEERPGKIVSHISNFA